MGAIPVSVETEFTDAMLTGNGGWSVLARLAKGLGLFGRPDAQGAARAGA